MDALNLLMQDKIWIDREGNQLLIVEMSDSHRRNAAGLLLKSAPRAGLAYSFRYALPDPETTGDAAMQSLEDDQWMALQYPQEWMKTIRLYKALMDLPTKAPWPRGDDLKLSEVEDQY